MTESHGTGGVYWVTGLSGTGKSTLAAALSAELRAMGRPTMVIDGDAVRDLLLVDAAMDRESRLRIAQFNGRLCRFLALQGLTTVCATISLFHSVHVWNRANLPNYCEIFLDTPLEQLEQRDSRGIYGLARAGQLTNVVGIDIAPEWPVAPDFIFLTDGSISPASMTARIVDLSQRIAESTATASS